VSGALDIRHLSVEIAGSPVLTDVILSIAPGAFVGLVGRNGAGKTTLMRAIMGLLPVRSGEMKFSTRICERLRRTAVPPSTSATC
jgi:ABC-type Mn2+/Zn2+ transport system ATPase subunit